MSLIKRLEALESAAAAKSQIRGKMDIVRVIVALDSSIVSACHRSQNGTNVPVSEKELADIRHQAGIDRVARRA